MGKIEVCVESVQSAVNAEKGGAHRLELCSALTIGGMTPSVALLEQVKDAVNIPVNCLIRSIPAGFLYTEREVTLMKGEIEKLKKSGADGFVIGCLTQDGHINIDHTSFRVDNFKIYNLLCRPRGYIYTVIIVNKTTV